MKNMLDLLAGLSIIQFFFAIISCVILSLAWFFHHQHQKHDHLPGPPRDSFWSGHLNSIQKILKAGGMIDDYFLEMSKKYGPIFRINLWHLTYVLVLDAESRKEVLVMRNLPKSKRLYSSLTHLLGQRFLGQGLETDWDQKHWIQQRMHFDAWFKTSNINKYTSDINEHGDKIVNYLEKKSDGKTAVSMLKVFHKAILHFICEIGFNFDLGDIEGDTHPFVADFDTCLEGTAKILADPLIYVNPMNWSFCRKVRKATLGVRKYGRERMEIRRQAKRNGDYSPDDLLEKILTLSDKMPSLPEKILIDNFITFLLAGHETTANALSFMVFLLGRNPTCYQKLQEEIDTTIGPKSVITPEDLESLTYLDLVFQETLRMYPIGPHTSRVTPKEMIMKDFKFPAGTIFLLSHYVTPRLEENITNPLKFIPERFDPKNPQRIDKFVSNPFSTGPHTCIGKKFAVMKAKIIMSKIIQKLDFALVPGQSMGVKEKGTLRLDGGATCFLQRRNQME